MIIKVAIDGPAGAGKSTVAKRVAHKLGVTYVDSGAIYRSLTWLALQRGVRLDDQQALTGLAEKLELSLVPDRAAQKVFVYDTDVTMAIREPEISSLVSKVAAYPSVRDKLLALQFQLAENSLGVVMDGRDIGTRILPHADVKVFLVASLEVRAIRRWEELRQKGFEASLEKVKCELRERDLADQNREASPLRAAQDAVVLDTSCLTIDEVSAMVAALCEVRRRGKEGC